MDLEIREVQRQRRVKARLGHRRLGVLAAAMTAVVAVLAPGLTRPASAAPTSADYIVTLKDGINANAFAAAADARSGGDPFRPIVAQGSGITQNYGYLVYAGGY